MKPLNKLSSKAPRSMRKKNTKAKLMKQHKRLFSLQNLLYAERKHALLIILQGMDASGKDGTIRHVFSCVNPQGCKVKSFKTPTEEERSHHFLWRIKRELPEKGMIQIFNRSYYEDILFPLVHSTVDEGEIEKRHEEIKRFETDLVEGGTMILKFYLHISEQEQKKRIEERKRDPRKKWKYDAADDVEAKHWNEYMSAYQKMLDGCRSNVPWIIVPSDQKWYRNYLVAATMLKALGHLKMKFPQNEISKKSNNTNENSTVS